MTNFTERAVPNLTANFLMKEAESRYHFAMKYMTSKKNVIDLACGTGYGSEILLTKVKSYIGIDINDEALSFAQKKYATPQVSFLKMDVNNTIFRDRSFDCAVAFEMIEHLTHQEVFLKEVSRILSKDGVLIVSTPNRFIQSPDGKLMSPYHTQEYSAEELHALLKKQFKNIEIFGQTKSKKAKEGVESFMFSQKVRQALVDIDVLGVRKLFTKDTKEYIWRILGNLVGRKAQELVRRSDFLITKKNIDSSEYLIAVCRK